MGIKKKTMQRGELNCKSCPVIILLDSWRPDLRLRMPQSLTVVKQQILDILYTLGMRVFRLAAKVNERLIKVGGLLHCAQI